MNSVDQWNNFPVVFPANGAYIASNVDSNAIVHEELTIIENNSLGNWLIGTSSLGHTEWTGSLLFYANSKPFCQENDVKLDCYTGCYVATSTLNDAKFISDSLVLVAEDNTSALKLLNLTAKEESSIAVSEASAVLGENRIQAIATWHDVESKFVTCSGKSAQLWNVKDSSIQNNQTYRNYHLENVTSIDTCKSQDFFVSCSADRNALLWDLRLKEGPAIVLYSNEFCGLTAITASKTNENQAVVACKSGDIFELDLRQSRQCVTHKHCFDSAIHRLRFDCADKLAVCGDLSKVMVVQINSDRFSTLYNYDQYPHAIQDVAWHDACLYSCGNNQTLYKHKL